MLLSRTTQIEALFSRHGDAWRPYVRDRRRSPCAGEQAAATAIAGSVDTDTMAPKVFVCITSVLWLAASRVRAFRVQ
jgi:hypothetical protein